jgi:hypothetical protein
VVVGRFSRGKTENFCRSVQDIKPCMQDKWNVPPDLKSAMGLKMQAVQKYSCISFLIPAQLHIQMHIIRGPKCVSNYLFRKIWIRLMGRHWKKKCISTFVLPAFKTLKSGEMYHHHLLQILYTVLNITCASAKHVMITTKTWRTTRPCFGFQSSNALIIVFI